MIFSKYACRSHIFDGVTVTKETAAFQLCDIEDEMLKEMIEDEEDLRESCNVCAQIFYHPSPLICPSRNETAGIVLTHLNRSRACSVTSSSHFCQAIFLLERNVKHG